MYSPYLFARGSELLALRDMVDKQVNVDCLMPILEPVKSDTKALLKCLNVWGGNGSKAIVICNPLQIDFHENEKNVQMLNADLDELFKIYPSLIRGFVVSSAASKNEIDKFISNANGSKVALIYNNPSLDNAEFNSVIQNQSVIYHVVLNDKVTLAQKAIIPPQKFIPVNDCFNKLARNADYGPPEPFSDLYKQIGISCIGVGDYTITGKVLEITGGLPSAVAAHLIYKNLSNNNVWVEHFVSDDVERQDSDVATKYLQMAKKIVSRVSVNRNMFGTNIALVYYADSVKNSYFPGLPKNKEYQMIHHMCLMMDVITGTI